MKINKQEARKTSVQLLKYGLVGVMNTIITLVVFYLLNTHAGAPYGLANIVAYIAGVINSFLMNRAWVFKAKEGKVARQALLFASGFVICWLLQGAVGWFLLEGLGWKDMEMVSWLPMKKPGQNIVMCLSMVVYTIANYIYNRFVAFGK